MVARVLLRCIGLARCAGLALITFSASAEEVSSWLNRMSDSFNELTYQGTLSYQRGDQIKSLRIAHTVIDGKEYERLEYLDGDRREVVRRDHRITCIHPGEKLLRIFSAPNAGSERPGAPGMTGQYRFELTERDRVAGRDVVNLSVMPRDSYRYGYRLSLDEESALMIRSELLGNDGEVLERFQFVEVEIGGRIPRQHFDSQPHSYRPPHAPGVGGDKPRRIKPEPVAATRPWQVSWLPAGFVPVNEGSDGDREQDMVTYTDGMAVFSVFVEYAERAPRGDEALAGSTRKGATSVYFKSLMLEDQPHKVTVVGEVPLLTARQVAESVTLAGR